MGFKRITARPDYLESDTPIIEYHIAEESYFNVMGFWYGDVFTIKQELNSYLDILTNSHTKELTMNFKISNMTTADEIPFLTLIEKIMGLMIGNNFKLILNWYYHKDDLDMLEKWEEWKERLKIPINLIIIYK